MLSLVLSEEKKAIVIKRVRVADRLFFELTDPVEECLYGSKENDDAYDREIDWWYYRVPKEKGENW